MGKIYNFSAGPAVLPPAVLEHARQEFSDYQGRGMSIMEMSHRSQEYQQINSEAELRLKRLLGVGDDYRVLFLQGGASTQFAMLPMNFLHPGTVADYILTGSWAQKAQAEAATMGQARAAASSKEEQYRRIPRPNEISLSPNPAYVHLTSNNTIFGTQWHTWPETGDRPLVADMSSDILSRPLDASKFSLIYAGAQKNIGPAGVTIVLVRTSWLEQAKSDVPTMLRYETYAKNNSLYNTPPVFAVYMVNLVLGWLEEHGGLQAMERHNREKAQLIYDTIDGSGGFYRGHAEVDSRSLMNVTFRLGSEELEKRFIAEAKEQRMSGLAGHRSVGGVRASIYNAMSREGCQALVSFMSDFARRNG